MRRNPVTDSTAPSRFATRPDTFSAVERVDIFRSGLPAIIAGIGLIVFAYLAVVRRDRLARYWVSAWGLLLARYVCNAFFDDNVLSSEYLNAVLRIGFAVTVFAGVWSLERPPLRAWWMTAAAFVVPALGVAVGLLTGAPALTSWVTLGAHAVLLTASAVLLARTATLPAAERRSTALALACYTVASTIAPGLPSGSGELVVAIAASSVCLILVAFGFFAVYFRQAYETELRAISTTSSQLTHALGEFVAVCMHCKSVQDEQRQWQPLERFVAGRRHTQLSHGLCESCAHTHYGEIQLS